MVFISENCVVRGIEIIALYADGVACYRLVVYKNMVKRSSPGFELSLYQI